MMIRRLLSIAALSALPLMTGCATTGLPNDASTWQKIQAAAIQACRFEPTFNTISSLLGLGLPYLSTISQIASAICDKIGPPAAMSSPGMPSGPPPTPTISGVRIEGRRL